MCIRDRLSEEQKAQVHAYALAILGRTGVRVDSPGVLRFLEAVSYTHLDVYKRQVGH